MTIPMILPKRAKRIQKGLVGETGEVGESFISFVVQSLIATSESSLTKFAFIRKVYKNSTSFLSSPISLG
jgi:hypothetical protein